MLRILGKSGKVQPIEVGSGSDMEEYDVVEDLSSWEFVNQSDDEDDDRYSFNEDDLDNDESHDEIAMKREDPFLLGSPSSDVSMESVSPPQISIPLDVPLVGLNHDYRTCCKSRGFQCPTHVKSTWVPVSRRRPRHFSFHQTSFSKRTRQLQQTPPFSGSEEERNFPAEVSLPAEFRCVRLSSVGNEADQFAYQSTVTIAGRVFKGILYDQGPESRYDVTGESSSGGLQHHNLITAAAAVAGGGATTTAAASPHPYPSPFSTFMPGTHFFSYPKS
nr:protein shi related sequence 1 [Ipomoea batatas]